jgi:hypothetical protein
MSVRTNITAEPAGLKGAPNDTFTAPARLTVRPITLALVALLVTAILAAAIVLATTPGDEKAGATKSAGVTPSAPTAGDIQRSQPPGVNGPGARP